MIEEEPDTDTVWIIPDWTGECLALMCEEWTKAGYMFDIKGELLDRLTVEAKRRAADA